MSNVKTGDLAIIVAPVGEAGVGAVGTVGRICAVGELCTVYTDKGEDIVRIEVAPTWMMTFPRATPYAVDLFTHQLVTAYEFPIPDKFLKRVSGPDVHAQDHSEIFFDGPINSEERVRIKEEKEAARKKSETPATTE